MKVHIVSTIELELSDKKLAEIKDRADLLEFIVTNCFRNNSRMVLDADLLVVTDNNPFYEHTDASSGTQRLLKHLEDAADIARDLRMIEWDEAERMAEVAGILPDENGNYVSSADDLQWDNATSLIEEAIEEVMKLDIQEGESMKRSMRIRIVSTGEEPAQDNYLIEDVKRLLLEYRGDDEVNAEVVTYGKVVTLEWPLVRVTVCPELEEKLEAILGPHGYVLIRGEA